MNARCFGLFIDVGNTLYCSVLDQDQVMIKWLHSDLDTSTVVISVGCSGLDAHILEDLHGIFIDTNFDLYVVDCGNDQIQHFQPG
jgi:hypothetical protein